MITETWEQEASDAIDHVVDLAARTRLALTIRDDRELARIELEGVYKRVADLAVRAINTGETGKELGRLELALDQLDVARSNLLNSMTTLARKLEEGTR